MAVTFRAAGTAASGTTSVACSQPSGTASGDLLLAFVVDHATSGNSTAPTGWTRRGGVAGTAGRFQVFSATVGQGGLTGTSWTFSGLTTRALGRIVGYSGADTTTPLDGITPSARLNASGTVGTTSITPASSGDMIVAAYAAMANGSTWSAESTTSPGGLTERADSANSTYCSLAIADGTQTTAGATGVSTATMATAGTNAAILLAIRANQTHAYAGSGSVANSGTATTSHTTNFTYTGGGGGPAGTFSRVQGDYALATSSPVTSLTVTLPSTPTPGNLLVAYVSPATQSLSSVKDAGNNTFTVTPGSPSHLASGPGPCYLAYLVVPATPSAAITLNLTTSDYCELRVSEFACSGAWEFDTDAVGNATGNPVTVPSITPATDGSLLYAGVSASGTPSTASPWTLDDEGSSYYNGGAYILASSGTQSVHFGVSGSSNTIVGAFKPLAGSGDAGVSISGEAVTSFTTGDVSDFPYSGSGDVVATGAGSISYAVHYAYSVSGTVLLSGAATTTRTANYSYVPTGSAVVVNGTATTGQTANYAKAGTGVVVATGVATTTHTYSYSYAGTGVESITGAATTSRSGNYASVGIGSLYVIGTATTGQTAKYSNTGSGSITATGTTSTAYTANYGHVASGNVVVIGSATTTATANYSASGSGVVSVLGVAATSYATVAGFTHSGSGSLSVNGGAATSYTRSFAIVGSGGVIASGSGASGSTANYSTTGAGSITVSGAAGTAYIVAGTGGVYVVTDVRAVCKLSITAANVRNGLAIASVGNTQRLSADKVTCINSIACANVEASTLITATAMANTIPEGQ